MNSEPLSCEINPEKTKVCNKCSSKKSVSCFYVETRRGDGLNPTCRKCLSEYKKLIALRNQQSDIKEKQCSKCGVLKGMVEFSKQSVGKGGKSSRCKDCIKEYDRERVLKNKECKVFEITCSKCLETKSSEFFRKNINRKNGKDNVCKDCKNSSCRESWWENREKELERSKENYYTHREARCAHYRRTWWENREKQLKRSKAYGIKHAEERSEYSKRWRKENAKTVKEVSRKWRVFNRDKTRYYSSKYRSLRNSATPPWLTESQSREIYNMHLLAKALEINTGKKFEVDHIVPLNGKNFCGLNVPWNLRVIEGVGEPVEGK